MVKPRIFICRFLSCFNGVAIISKYIPRMMILKVVDFNNSTTYTIMQGLTLSFPPSILPALASNFYLFFPMKSSIHEHNYQCIERIEVEFERLIEWKGKSFLDQRIRKLPGGREKCLFCHGNYF